MHEPEKRYTLQAFGLVTCLVAVAACSRPGSLMNASDGRVSSDLELLRAATAPFNVLDSAANAGYSRVVRDCLVHEHHGAMGFHHVNAALVDGKLDVTRPEILLYERISEKEYRLNGVEFIVPYRSWARDSVAPEVMGQKLMQEDNLKIWYLHVWVWKRNPDGLFANFHPMVKCPPDMSVVFRPSAN